MGKVTPKQRAKRIAVELVKRGEQAAPSQLYADAFVEYQQATENIQRVGAIVADRRAHKPIPNPYLKVRDSALANLTKLGKRMDIDWLWQ